MIIKMDKVTGGQIHELQEFIDSDENIYVMHVNNRSESMSIIKFRQKEPNSESLIGTQIYLTWNPVSLVKCEGMSNGPIQSNRRLDTTFGIVLELKNNSSRDVINKVWDILGVCPEN